MQNILLGKNIFSIPKYFPSANNFLLFLFCMSSPRQKIYFPSSILSSFSFSVFLLLCKKYVFLLHIFSSFSFFVNCKKNMFFSLHIFLLVVLFLLRFSFPPQQTYFSFPNIFLLFFLLFFKSLK